MLNLNYSLLQLKKLLWLQCLVFGV